MSRGNPEMQPGGWLGAGGLEAGSRLGARSVGWGLGAGGWGLGVRAGGRGWGWAEAGGGRLGLPCCGLAAGLGLAAGWGWGLAGGRELGERAGTGGGG